MTSQDIIRLLFIDWNGQKNLCRRLDCYIIENTMLIPSMNRIYYAMFYAVQALLARDDVAFSKHGQIKGAILIVVYQNRIFSS